MQLGKFVAKVCRGRRCGLCGCGLFGCGLCGCGYCGCGLFWCDRCGRGRQCFPKAMAARRNAQVQSPSLHKIFISKRTLHESGVFLWEILLLNTFCGYLPLSHIVSQRWSKSWISNFLWKWTRMFKNAVRVRFLTTATAEKTAEAATCQFYQSCSFRSL